MPAITAVTSGVRAELAQRHLGRMSRWHPARPLVTRLAATHTRARDAALAQLPEADRIRAEAAIATLAELMRRSRS